MTAMSEKCSSANGDHVYVLILCKREKVRSASALLIGRGQPIIRRQWMRILHYKMVVIVTR